MMRLTREYVGGVAGFGVGMVTGSWLTWVGTRLW